LAERWTFNPLAAGSIPAEGDVFFFPFAFLISQCRHLVRVIEKADSKKKLASARSALNLLDVAVFSLLWVPEEDSTRSVNRKELIRPKSSTQVCSVRVV
jgi:hypothetical protein